MRKISSYLNTNLKPSLDKYMLLSLFILLVWVFYPTLPATASSTDNVSGYAWSETVGWISFNCIDTGSCASSNYGVNIDFATGNLSGYAWSEHIGWISFERATTNNPPQAPFNTGSGPIARYNSGTGMLEGWARALSGCENTPGTPLSPCPQTSAGGASGGFDGWIKLSGVATNGSSYGVSVSSSGDSSGFAWGSEVVGWVDFSLVNVAMPGNPSVILEANPNPVSSTPSPVTLTWTVANVTNCTASDAWTGSKNNANGVHSELVTVNSTPVTFVLTCLDSFGEPINSSVTVTEVGVPYISLTALPDTINSGDSTTLNWTTTNMVNCTASNNGGIPTWTGSKPVNTSLSESTGPLTTDTTFTLDCVGTDDLNYSGFIPVTVNSSLPVPTGTISADSCEIPIGGSSCPSSVYWNSNNFLGSASVLQNVTPFSSSNNGSVDRQVTPTNNNFTLRDMGSTFSVSANAGVSCQSGSSWNGSTCEATPPPPPTLNSLSLTANPNIIRSGRTSTLNIIVDSNATLACYLSGGINESFIHNGSVSQIQTYTRNTDLLQSTQIVKVKCDSTPGNTLGTAETRITVIPTVQEI